MNRGKERGLIFSLLVFVLSLGAFCADLQVTDAALGIGTVRVTFSSPVDPQTLTADSLKILGRNGALPYTLRLLPGGSRLAIKLKIVHWPALFKPLVITLSPDVRDLGGNSLSKGYLKVFNLVQLTPVGKGNPLIDHRVETLSSDPRIDLDIWSFVAFWSSSRMDSLKKEFDPAATPEEKRALENLEQTFLQEREQSRNPDSPQRLRRGSLFPAQHPPRLAVSGIRDGDRLSGEVKATITASDEDNNLWAASSWETFLPYVSGAVIKGMGSRWLFALALDSGHLFDVKILRFTILPPAPPKVSLSHPQAGLCLSAPTVDVSGTVASQSRILSVLVNDYPAALEGKNFSLSLPLKEGENRITDVTKD